MKFFIDHDGNKKWVKRFWCQCPVCKGKCGVMIDKRAIKYDMVCSDCRAGKHVVDIPKEKAKQILDKYLSKEKKKFVKLLKKNKLGIPDYLKGVYNLVYCVLMCHSFL